MDQISSISVARNNLEEPNCGSTILHAGTPLSAANGSSDTNGVRRRGSLRHGGSLPIHKHGDCNSSSKVGVAGASVVFSSDVGARESPSGLVGSVEHEVQENRGVWSISEDVAEKVS